ncbi:disease resistance protein RPH8A-like [Magnolia sinica]|uniref:disease resistance protein RPH8A-like n=1 Tax=Magnolia sinica TaxID=86752 RepID=UPI00265A4221|nr:disease resistance protein RPH8A-like [Magnolia sinica]
MDLKKVRISSLPDEIGYLIHLRYLRFSGMYLEMLPSTVTRLSNLHTLNLKSTSIHMLPDDIGKMDQMQHLLLFRQCRISNGTQLHLGKLQTLTSVEAGGWIEDGLIKLTNLREIGITGVAIRGDLDMTLSRSVSKLVLLRSLLLIAGHQSTIPALEFSSNHQHLYKMELSGCIEKLLDLHEFPPKTVKIRARPDGNAGEAAKASDSQITN